MAAHGYRISFMGDENVLKLDSGNSYTILKMLKAAELSTLKE